MSETLHLARVGTANGVSQKTNKPWARWDFFDAQGTKIGSTFMAALGNAAQAHVGGMVDVEREHDGTGYKVTAIRPAANGVPGQPQPQQAPPPAQQVVPPQPLTTSAPPPAPVQQAASQQYWKPRDPAEQAAIRRQCALKAAAHVCAGREGIGTKDVLGLAESFDNWLSAPLNPDDIPF